VGRNENNVTSTSTNLASETAVTDASESIRVATPDLIIFDPNSTSADAMSDLIFEDIGGEELIEISRSDLINSANVVFPKIKNVVRVIPQQSIDQMAGYSDTADDDTNNYPLTLSSYVPLYIEPVEIDETTGSIIINTTGMTPDLQIEVQFVANAKLFDDTIY
jgi:hypothetical protein